MKRIALAFIFSSLVLLTYAQSGWESWDANYPKTNFKNIIDSENAYARKVESDSAETQYYNRLDKYKVEAKYLGKTRAINVNVLSSMKRVFKLYIGNPEQLDEMAKTEVLIEIEGEKVWMPIQEPLLVDFKKEIKDGNYVTLYCLFLNEHSQDKTLYNTFFISEFRK
jgi:hypothetical protein